MSTPSILFIGADRNALPILDFASALGIRTIVLDKKPTKPAFARADERLLADPADPSTCLDEALRIHRDSHPLTGLIATQGAHIQTAAFLAHRLSLPGPVLSDPLLFQDRIARLQRLQAQGLPVPWFLEVENPLHLETLLEVNDHPLAVLPVDQPTPFYSPLPQSGVAGAELFHRVRRLSMSNRLLALAETTGERVIVTGAVHSGSFQLLLSERCNEQNLCSPCERTDFCPSQVEALLLRAAKALGCANTLIHAEIVLTPDGPCLLDLNLGLAEGFLTEQLMAANQLSPLFELCLSNQAFPEAMAPPIANDLVSITLRAPMLSPAGIVTGLGPKDGLDHVPDRLLVHLDVGLGERVADRGDGQGITGWMCAFSTTSQDAEDRLIRGQKALQVLTSPASQIHQTA